MFSEHERLLLADLCDVVSYWRYQQLIDRPMDAEQLAERIRLVLRNHEAPAARLDGVAAALRQPDLPFQGQAKQVIQRFVGRGIPAPVDYVSAMAAIISSALRDAVVSEREECAKVAETTGRLHPMFADRMLQERIAERIRDRGKS